MKKIAVVLLLIIGTSCEMCRDMRSLGVNEFSRYLKRRNVVLIDVRTPEEYAEGHIPGTDFNINVLDDSFEREILDRISPDSHVAIYCRSGNRSRQAALKLSSMGYTNVIEFGGIMDWTGEIEK